MGGRSVEKGWVEGGLCWLDDAGRVEGARRAWLCQADDDDEDEEETETWLGQTSANGEVTPTMLFVVLPTGSLPRSARRSNGSSARTRVASLRLSKLQRTTPLLSATMKRQTNQAATPPTYASAAFPPPSNPPTISCSKSSTHHQQRVRSELVCVLPFDVPLLRLLWMVEMRSSPQYRPVPIVRTPRSSSSRNNAEAGLAVDVLTHLFSSCREGDDIGMLAQAQRISCSALHILTADSAAQQVEIALVWHGL